MGGAGDGQGNMGAHDKLMKNKRRGTSINRVTDGEVETGEQMSQVMS